METYEKTTGMKKVAVVILNYNGKKFLEQFLPNVIENTDGAMADIVENPDAVYGFSPDPASTRLGKYADAIDWTDPDQVAAARAERVAYHESMSELYRMIEDMLHQGKNVEFEVRNTCDNIPEGNLDKLFDRFYRADTSRSRKSGGYGIGLSVARAIANSHGGSIEALRDGDHAIRFVVKLPKGKA